MEEKDAWFELLDADDITITQGDLLFDCVVPDSAAACNLKLEDADNKLVFEPKRIDAIVMTQACRFAQDKATNITLCAFVPLEELITTLSKEGMSNGDIGNLVGNAQAGRHSTVIILDKYNVPNQYGYNHDYIALLLDNIYTISYDEACEIARYQKKPRVRLRIPYREYVNRAFGNQFSNIGLPNDIDRRATKNLLKDILRS